MNIYHTNLRNHVSHIAVGGKNLNHSKNKNQLLLRIP
jgi:hypothetical protein